MRTKNHPPRLRCPRPSVYRTPLKTSVGGMFFGGSDTDGDMIQYIPVKAPEQGALWLSKEGRFVCMYYSPLILSHPAQVHNSLSCTAYSPSFIPSCISTTHPHSCHCSSYQVNHTYQQQYQMYLQLRHIMGQTGLSLLLLMALILAIDAVLKWKVCSGMLVVRCARACGAHVLAVCVCACARGTQAAFSLPTY